jgi:CBS domain-containing protein
MSTVKTILDRKGTHVLAIQPGVTVFGAARLMNEKRVGGLIVMQDATVVGIFTERDILRRVVGEARDPITTPVRDVMTTPVFTCSPETRLDDLIEAITRNRIRHIPVVSNGDLCGVITSGDILAHQLLESREQLTYLHEYMHGV